MTAPREHDFEPMPGLPARLPEDEYILWQGRPDWRALALEALHTRALATYFGAIIVWRLASGIYDGDMFWSIAMSVVVFCVLGALAIGLFEFFAWLVQKTTLYTITNRRIVMRIGVVLSMTVNLPFATIAAADVRRGRGSGGTIALTLKTQSPFSWMVLWPHARPWHLSAPKPAMRAIPDVERVAQILGEALARSLAAREGEEPAGHDAPAETTGTMPARAAGAAARPRHEVPVAARLQGAAG